MRYCDEKLGGALERGHIERTIFEPSPPVGLGGLCFVFLSIMLFLYAQNSTDYALNYAPKLPIMLKLCSLFLEGASLYVQIIALLCYVQHNNFITNLKLGLVAAIT